MPRNKRRGARASESYTDSHVSQLRTGWDFFHSAWGDDLPHDAQTLESMCAAWKMLRPEVEARHRQHWGDNRPCWAAKQFDAA